MIFESVGESVLVVAVLGLGVLATIALRKVRAYRLQVERVARERDSYLVQLGHEIRNPLNAIVGVADLLVQDASSSEQRENALAIQSSADHLLTLTTNLLTLFGGVSQQFPSQLAELDLIAELDTVQRALAPAAFEKRLPLHVRHEVESPVRIETDRFQLHQMLTNVIAHAIGVSDHGTVEVVVHPIDGSVSEMGTLRITVSDSGPALSDATLQRLFDPFGLQGQVAGGNPPGTGLNLSVAQTFARHLAGDLQYKPHNSVGGIYEITLPVRILSKSTTATAGPRNDDQVVSFDSLFAKHRAQLPPQRILVAEDQRNNQLMLEGILTKAGHSFVMASTGDEALKKLSVEDFDLALVDLRLPGTGGLDVMRLAKVSSPRNKNIPYVVLTGETSEKVRQACFAAGASEFLNKPVKADRLLNTLVSVLSAPESPHRKAFLQFGAILDIETLRNLGGQYGPPPRVVTDALRDALRYITEMENAAQIGAWAIIRHRARALRGAALSYGAVHVAGVCTRIMDTSLAQLEQLWPGLSSDLTQRQQEATTALTSAYQERPVEA